MKCPPSLQTFPDLAAWSREGHLQSPCWAPELTIPRLPACWCKRMRSTKGRGGWRDEEDEGTRSTKGQGARRDEEPALRRSAGFDAGFVAPPAGLTTSEATHHLCLAAAGTIKFYFVIYCERHAGSLSLQVYACCLFPGELLLTCSSCLKAAVQDIFFFLTLSYNKWARVSALDLLVEH